MGSCDSTFGDSARAPRGSLSAVTSRPRVGTGILRIRALAHLIAAVDRSKAEPDPPHDRPSVPDAPAGSTQKGVASETPEKPRFDIADAMANRERACERVRHLTRHLGATDPSDERDAVERNPTAAGENPAHIPPRADRVKKRAKGRFFPAGSQTLKVPHTPPTPESTLTRDPPTIHQARTRRSGSPPAAAPGPLPSPTTAPASATRCPSPTTASSPPPRSRPSRLAATATGSSSTTRGT